MFTSELRDALIDTAQTAFCTLTAPQAAASRYFAENLSGSPLLAPGITLPARTYSNAQAALCGTLPTPDTLESGETMEIGQCMTAYSWRWKYRYQESNGFIRDTTGQPDADESPLTPPVMGPLSRPFQDPDVPNGWTFTDGNGVKQGTIAFLPAGGTFLEDDWQVFRRDGQPDDCGAVVPPPPLTPAERTINLPVQVGPDTVNVDFTINPPIVGVGGALVVPIGIVAPDFNYDIDFNLQTGDANFNFGGGVDGGECCPENDEPQDENRRILGVMIENLSATPGRYVQEIPTTTGPQIYGPYVGLIRFVRANVLEAFYTEDFPVKSDRQDIRCPWPEGASGWVVEQQPNCSFDVRPYFAKITEQST